MSCTAAWQANIRRPGQPVKIVDWMAGLQSLQHTAFFVDGRIAEAEPNQEAVELRFGQRKRAFVIDGILSRDDEKRRLERVRVSIRGHARFRPLLRARPTGCAAWSD